MKKLFCGLLSLTLCFSPIADYTQFNTYTNVYATSSSNEEKYTITGVGVNSPTQEQIAGFYSSYNISRALSTDNTYNINPLSESTPYSTGGQLSDNTQTNAINTLNYIRYIAGLSYNVKNDDAYAQLAQDASFINYLNGNLSHTPSKPSNVTDALYDSGYLGAKSSNISSASYHNKISNVIINGWLKDGDSSNIATLGHRRWILNPAMSKTGFGSVDGKASAMYAFDKSGSDVTGVAWPAQNTPLNAFSNEFPWSYSANRELSSNVEVVLTQLNKSNSWTFNNSSSGSATSGNYFNVENSGYGQKGCVVFDPNTSISAGDVFWVEITENKSVIASYPVSFFNVENVSTNNNLTPSSTSSTFTYSSSGSSSNTGSSGNTSNDNSSNLNSNTNDSTVDVSSSGLVTFSSSNSYPLLDLDDINGLTSLTVNPYSDNFYVKTSSATTKSVNIKLPTYDGSDTVTWTIPSGVKLNGDVNLGVKINSSKISNVDSGYTSNGSITFLHSGSLVSSGSALTVTFPVPYGTISSGDTIKIQKSGSTLTVNGSYVTSSKISASFDNCSTWNVSSGYSDSSSSNSNSNSSSSSSSSSSNLSSYSYNSSSLSSNYNNFSGLYNYNNYVVTPNNSSNTSIPYCSSFAYIPEFHNVIVGQLIDLTKVYVNGGFVTEWFYDKELTQLIPYPEFFVVTQYAIDGGLYNKFSQNDNLVYNNSTNNNPNTSSNYVYYNNNPNTSSNYVYYNNNPNTSSNYVYYNNQNTNSYYVYNQEYGMYTDSYGNTPVPSTAIISLNRLF